MWGSTLVRRHATSSKSPSITRSSSSGLTRPKRFPRRSVESVRICEIFTQEGLGSLTLPILRVSGKPARWAWLVSARAMTVPDPLIEDVVADHQHGPAPGLFAAAAGVEIGPIDFTPQYSGQ